MRQHVSALFLMLLSALFAPAIMAQGDVSILFNGVMPMDNIRIPGDKFGISQMEKDDFNHGVEVRFQDTKRFSFGVGWNRWGHLSDFSQKSTTVSIEGVDGHYFNRVSSELEERKIANINSFIGSVYYNCLKKGKLRPFIGVGVGVNFTEETMSTPGWIDAYLASGFSALSEKNQKNTSPIVTVVINEKDTVNINTRIKSAYKAVVGVNYYPHKNFVLSISAGYFNGPAMIPGVGVTF